ncbi:hypothetical protein M0R45_004915 [Rubus argutus]|uniref:Mechanosensitive ion channel protein 2, chloroplastic-like n=1 Tax=Rubus argutus TaxID=59490 RepID=A0AAW1YLN9_RUBAR
MVLTGSLQLSLGLGLCKNQGYQKQFKRGIGGDKLHLSSTSLTSRVSKYTDPHILYLTDINVFKCYSSVTSGQPFGQHGFNTAAMVLNRSYKHFTRISSCIQIGSQSVGVIIFAIWGLAPLMRLSRNLILHKSDSSWKKSNTHYVTNSYIQPLLLWTGAMLICRALDPVVLPTEASHVVKQRLLDFTRSLSTVLSFAYCLSSLIQQTQKFFMENNESSDTRNMGFQFAGKAVYSAVWVAAVSLFMELLGFSTQKWLTAGGLGTVLLTLAGREIFTNFLSISGTVEHVGWWSPTIVRGEDREAVHIPNHKFTVNVVRNLSQKTHWRIKTHLAISHLDVHKINNIVADMRKVLSKNPQVEQQRLHRRVFLENVTPENQALMILISCFVKTSHHEEYLCVKEAILMDLLRVISHHKARLATPIRTVQKMYSDTDLDSIPFAGFNINGEDKKRSRSVQTSGERDGKATVRPPPDSKVDAKVGATSVFDSKFSETPSSDTKGDTRTPNLNTKEDPKASKSSTSDPKVAEISSDHLTKKMSGGKQLNNASGNVIQSTSSNPTPSSSASDSDKTGGSMTSPVKPEGEKMSGAEPPTSRPALEENIVLGVALEGSKRTLPIEEGMASPSSHADANDLASFRKGNVSSNTDKGKKNDQVPAAPGSI